MNRIAYVAIVLTFITKINAQTGILFAHETIDPVYKGNALVQPISIFETVFTSEQAVFVLGENEVKILRYALAADGANNSQLVNGTYNVYIVRANPIQFKKICWLPFRRASYSVNIPPGSKLIYLRHTIGKDGSPTVLAKGISNQSANWVFVSAIGENGNLNFSVSESSATNVSITAKQASTMEASLHSISTN